jgi:hypothetical protein
MENRRTVKDIYWLAGILEGEACFHSTGRSLCCPAITINMVDEDTIAKVGKIFNRQPYTSNRNMKYGWKLLHCISVSSDEAAGWMFTIYSLMSKRRKEQIREVLSKWKTIEAKDRVNFPCGHPRNESNFIYTGRYTKCAICNRLRAKKHYEGKKNAL